MILQVTQAAISVTLPPGASWRICFASLYARAGVVQNDPVVNAFAGMWRRFTARGADLAPSIAHSSPEKRQKLCTCRRTHRYCSNQASLESRSCSVPSLLKTLYAVTSTVITAVTASAPPVKTLAAETLTVDVASGSPSGSYVGFSLSDPTCGFASVRVTAPLPGLSNAVSVTFPAKGTYFLCYSVEGQAFFPQNLPALSVDWGMHA